MFDALSERLGGIFDGLTRRGVLKEQDVDAAMREIRVAMLEADVALPVVRDFIAKVKPAALGREVLRSVTPGQMVVKIVHDELVGMLGDDSAAGVSLAAAHADLDFNSRTTRVRYDTPVIAGFMASVSHSDGVQSPLS